MRINGAAFSYRSRLGRHGQEEVIREGDFARDVKFAQFFPGFDQLQFARMENSRGSFVGGYICMA
jgi:hypothetical protein